MPVSGMTADEVAAEIKTRLGGNIVEIELAPADYTHCIKETVRVLSRNCPGRLWGVVDVVPSTKKYSLAAFTGLQGVITVDFITQHLSSGVDPFDPFYTVIGGIKYGIPGSTYGEYQQQLTYMEDARRIVGSEPEWEFVWEGSTPYLYIDVLRDNILCAFEYAMSWTPDANATTGMQLIPDTHEQWVVDMATAKAMQILGRVRGKYGGVANSEGGTDESDGRELLQEGREQEQNLMDEIRQRRRPLLPTIG